MSEPSTGSTTTRGRDLCRLEGMSGSNHPFCDICIKLKGVEGRNYFAIMDLETRMTIDLERLEENYHRLSRELHPDFHRDKPEAERVKLLQKSADVNNAYKTLKSPVARAEYLLRLLGCGRDQKSRQVPPALAEVVFEVQDLLMEWTGGGADDPARADDLRERLEQWRDFVRRERKQSIETLQQEFAHWDQLVDLADSNGVSEDEHAERGTDLLKTFRDKVKLWSYLERLWQQINDALVA